MNPFPHGEKGQKGQYWQRYVVLPPLLLLPLCDAPRILRAPYCETRIIDICYTSVSFSNGIDQTWRQWGEKFFTVLSRRINFTRSNFSSFSRSSEYYSRGKWVNFFEFSKKEEEEETESKWTNEWINFIPNYKPSSKFVKPIFLWYIHIHSKIMICFTLRRSRTIIKEQTDTFDFHQRPSYEPWALRSRLLQSIPPPNV